jgi:sigma-E factor negative regulatory protein RseB
VSALHHKTRIAALLALCLSAGIALAEEAGQEEALALLQKIADAARKLNYAGTFVYQRGDRVETSRIVHFVEGANEFEKLETLDGPRREVIRNNDEVLCYYPDAKIVRSDKRMARRTFPALLPEQLSTLSDYYEIRMGESERIGGLESQALILAPRDGMRYGHKFWADANTGLLLKARTLNERQLVVEQFSFTQLIIGSGVTRQMVQPSFDVRSPLWRRDRFANNMIDEVDSGWSVGSFPAGFRKILEMRRSKQGHAAQVIHLVYSDGLAAVSVFIEPVATRSRLSDGLSQQGAINIFTRIINGQVVTVLGEAPASTVMLIANSVAPRAK